MFTNEELKNLAVLLQRVDLKGNEALAVAHLQQKVAGFIEIPSPTTGTETPGITTTETTGTEKVSKE